MNKVSYTESLNKEIIRSEICDIKFYLEKIEEQLNDNNYNFEEKIELIERTCKLMKKRRNQNYYLKKERIELNERINQD